MITPEEIERIRAYKIDELNEAILEYIKGNPGCRQRDVMVGVGLTTSQVQWRLFQLAIHGYLDVDTSERKKTRYSISKNVDVSERMKHVIRLVQTKNCEEIKMTTIKRNKWLESQTSRNPVDIDIVKRNAESGGFL